MISCLLKSGAEIEATGYRNICAPLHCAASSGHAEAVRFLLQHGAKIEAIDRHNKTPMHYAASNERPEVLKVLAQNGGNINAESPTHTLPETPPVTPLIQSTSIP